MPVALIVPEAMRDRRGPYRQTLEDAGFEVRYPLNPLLARGGCGLEETVAELSVADATIASGESYADDVLARLPKLRVIARSGVGYDRVDVAAATRRGIALTITPTANHEAVAEMTLALLFAVAKRIVVNDQAVRDGQWPRDLPLAIRGKTLGIVGLGRIGSSLAFRAGALGMTVVATEPRPNVEFVRAHRIQLLSLEALLAASDVVSLHLPLMDATRGMFNRQLFNQMKRGSLFLNLARGSMVVEADLLEALRGGHLAGAGLDVFEREPPGRDNPLFQLPNVVVSPHIAGADELSSEAMGAEAASCIAQLYQNDWPEGAVVNQQLRSGWCWNRPSA